MTSCFMSNGSLGKARSAFRHGDFQEGRGDFGSFAALVLGDEQLAKLLGQLALAEVLRCRLERVHRRPVEAPERVEQAGRRTVAAEVPGALLEADVRRGDPCRFEALAHLALVAPSHGT